MGVLGSQPIVAEFIKMRWMEPYVTGALNQKSFATLPRGVYKGFVIRPGPGALDVTVHSDDPAGWDATSGGYAGGAFDAASGWSIAVHESVCGFTTNIIMQEGVSANFTFDLTSYVGESVFIALDVQYDLGFPTTGSVELVDAAALDADPTLLCLGRIDVPSVGQIFDINIVYTDPVYPRVLPFANLNTMGYMSAAQAQILDALSIPNASNAFEEEVIVSSNGIQVIDIPNAVSGNIYTVGGEDLWVFRNGIKKTRGRDYLEIDRGDGRGQSINYIDPSLRAGDYIVFRGQAYAVSLVSALFVLDNNALIQTNTTVINFEGSGIVVSPGGLGRVNVTIPTVGGGAGAAKSKYNATMSSIPSYHGVALLIDGTIEPCDPTVSGDYLYGLTTEAIDPGDFGNVIITPGLLTGAALGVSGDVGDFLYLSDAGDGSLSLTPPSNPLLSKIYQVGQIDCQDGVSGDIPYDIVYVPVRLA